MTPLLSRRSFFVAAGLVCPWCNAAGFPKSEDEDPLPKPAPAVRPNVLAGVWGCAIRSGDIAEIAKHRVSRTELGDLTPLWEAITVAEKQALQAFLGVEAQIGFFRDESPNAVALRPDGPSTGDGTILLGMDLCRRIIGFRGESAIVGVLAHEAAHLVQFRRQPAAQNQPFGAGMRTIMMAEIHADFIAGWYFAQKILNHVRGLNLFDFTAVLEVLGDTEYSAPDHHGTADERRKAMWAGDRAARHGGATDVQTAYDQGVAYARQIALP